MKIFLFVLILFTIPFSEENCDPIQEETIKNLERQIQILKENTAIMDSTLNYQIGIIKTQWEIIRVLNKKTNEKENKI
jgi:hypothetical protein